MHVSALLPAIAALSLVTACGPRAVVLPDQPVERAATCGVVAAAEARLGTTDIQAPLPLETHGRIVHYALLAASEDGDFSAEQASTISRRMSESFERITAGDWKALPAACSAAYPVAGKKDVALPEDRFEAQLQCSELAEFLLAALRGQGGAFFNELAAWRGMRTRLNDAVAPGLDAKAGKEWEDQQRARRKALAAAARLGTPTAVMESCAERFPPRK